MIFILGCVDFVINLIIAMSYVLYRRSLWIGTEFNMQLNDGLDILKMIDVYWHEENVR